MSNIIDIISRKWSQEVGTIDLKNHKHVATLSRMLLEMDMSFDDVQESISKLVEDDDDKYVFSTYPPILSSCYPSITWIKMYNNINFSITNWICS